MTTALPEQDGFNERLVAGQDAGERIMSNLDPRRFSGVPKPTSQQVAMVLHAMADHTAIMKMLSYRPDETSPWPEATSIGRWFHDVGDSLEDTHGTK